MKFKRKFGDQKKTNPQRGLFLIVLLVVILYLFFNAESILGKLL